MESGTCPLALRVSAGIRNVADFEADAQFGDSNPFISAATSKSELYQSSAR